MARRGDNICIIELNEGPVTIKLTMPDNIMCGGDFKVYDQSRNNVIEQFKMSANPGEFAIANISTWPRDLNKCFLAWTVLCCSNTASVYKGVPRIEFRQMDNFCKLTFPLEWNMMNIPPCKLGSSESFSGSVMFIVKS